MRDKVLWRSLGNRGMSSSTKRFSYAKSYFALLLSFSSLLFGYSVQILSGNGENIKMYRALNSFTCSTGWRNPVTSSKKVIKWEV